MSTEKNIQSDTSPILFKVIYADPPWEQKAGPTIGPYKVVDGKQVFATACNKTRDLPYSTMSLDDICKIPVKEIADKDSFLFMWVTNKYLLESKKVIDSWGFKYVACITWKKKRMGGGLGGTVRITSEHLLFCRRGKLKANAVIPESVIEAKRPYVNGYPCHSKKPEVFAEMIEKLCDGPYLEMFARSKRDGWHVWGNEVDSSVLIKPQNFC